MKAFNRLLQKLTPFVLLVFGVLLIVFGVIRVRQSATYTRIDAVITRIEVSYHADDSDDYDVYVGYTVDGQRYEELFDEYLIGYHEGKTVKAMYDPDDPSHIVSAGAASVWIPIAVGALLLIAGLFMCARMIMPYIMSRRSSKPDWEL